MVSQHFIDAVLEARQSTPGVRKVEYKFVHELKIITG